ncbi:PEGA domain-containing protein [Candidatus Woesearchaeota archaeon]|nr:PEGA domain-containing protein [Candidatus Woesearchaeota archaeon]
MADKKAVVGAVLLVLFSGILLLSNYFGGENFDTGNVPRRVNSDPWRPLVVGTLQVDSIPSGATVTIDGTVKGSTPLELKLRPGSYSLQISRIGYNTRIQNVNVEVAETTFVQTELMPLY